MLKFCFKGTENTLVEFLSFTQRKTTFVTSCLHCCMPSPSEKGSTLKGKNGELPFFPFGVDLFSEGKIT